MSNKRIILVTGATGAQGGSVAAALLKDDKFRVRVLTRKPQSQKALVLQRAGAEIVKGDMADIESLAAAMKDVYGVFGVTSYWEHFDKELQLGRNLIDAVNETGVQHLVMNSLPCYNKLSGGEFAVPEYDTKAKLEEYARSLDIPATFVGMGFYYENFLNFFAPQKDTHGGYYFGFPQGNAKLAMASVEDLGAIVVPVFNNPEKYMGRMIMAVGADLTGDEIAAIMSLVLNKQIYYNHIPRNIYAAYDFTGAEGLADMFEVQRLFVPNRQAAMELSYRINPSMQTFGHWVERNRARFIRHFNSLYEVGII